MQKKSLNILLVEDNVDHAELTKRTLKKCRAKDKLYHVSNGEAAVDYLFRQGEYTSPEKNPRPELILLDLRLPKVDGLEVLNKIKNSEHFKDIPVVILTTSGAENDIAKACDYRADSYLMKPVNADKFKCLIRDLGL